MHYTCRFFSSSNTPESFSRHWENEPDDQYIFSKRGHLFGLITIKNPQSDDIGNQIISQINQTYFSDNDTDFKTHLKDTLSKIYDLWKDQDISILLVATNSGQLMASGVGQVQLFLNRLSSFSLILESNSDEIVIASGPLKDKDLLFLTNQEFSQKLDKIENLFSSPDLNQLEDYVKDKINPFPSSSVIIQANQDENSSSDQNIKPVTLSSPLPSSPSVLPSPQINFDNPITKKPKTNFNLKFLSKIFSKSDIKVNTAIQKNTKNNKKINLILISVSFIILSVSVYLGYQKNQLNQRHLQFDDIEKQIVQSLDDISKVRQLNFEDALVLAQQTKELVDKIDTLDINPEKVAEYRTQIEEILSQTGSTDFSNLDEFYDTSLITDNPSYSQIYFDQGNLYLLDTSKNRIDKLTVDTKSTQSISQDDLSSQVLELITFKNDVYALTKDALYLVKKNNWDKVLDLAGLEIISVKPWTSSLYFLSPSAIYKSNLVNNVLAEPVSWLDADQSLSSNLVDFAIDGKIWTLTKQAKITPYLRGLQDNFKLSQPPQTDSSLALNIAIDLDILVFLANPNSLMIYTKSGDLLSVYNFDNKDIISAILDESTQTVFLLSSDQKIYKKSL